VLLVSKDMIVSGVWSPLCDTSAAGNSNMRNLSLVVLEVERHDIVFHPAFFAYCMKFHRGMEEKRDFCFYLCSVTALCNE